MQRRGIHIEICSGCKRIFIRLKNKEYRRDYYCYWKRDKGIVEGRSCFLTKIIMVMIVMHMMIIICVI